MKKHIALIIILLTVSATSFGNPPMDISELHSGIIENWLKTMPRTRLASLDDYEADMFENAKEVEGDGFLPFYTTGDFNDDGTGDFGIIVISENEEDDYSVAVFNGPFESTQGQKPAFLTSEWVDEGDIVIFKNELLVGPFNSDDVVILNPVGKTYEVEFNF